MQVELLFPGSQTITNMIIFPLCPDQHHIAANAAFLAQLVCVDSSYVRDSLQLHFSLKLSPSVFCLISCYSHKHPQI